MVFTAIELISMANSLITLAQKTAMEKREATQAEVDASFASRNDAKVQAHAALERARNREAAGG